MSEKNNLFETNKDYEACKAEAPDVKQMHDAIIQLDENIPDWVKPLQSLIVPLQEKINNLPDCYERQILKKQLQELEDLRIAHKQFMGEKFTGTTNAKIKELFKDVNLENLKSRKDNIVKIMGDEKKKLEDTILLWEKSYRDHIENSVDFNPTSTFDIAGHLFNGTWFESKEVENFLKLFTIEYINTLNRNWKNEINTDSENLHISESELKATLKKLGSRINRSSLSMKFTIKEWKEVNVNFREYTKDYKESRKIEAEIKNLSTPIKQLQELWFMREWSILDESIVLSNIDDPNKLRDIQEELREKQREQIIKYQITKGLIKDKESDWAGEIISSIDETKKSDGKRNIWEITAKNIELSYKIMKSAEKRYKWKISQELLRHEKADTSLKLSTFTSDKEINTKKKLRHIWYFNTKKSIIEFQIKEWIIKNKDSYWAWNIWPSTTLKIEKIYKAIKLKEWVPEWTSTLSLGLMWTIIWETANGIDMGNGVKKNITISKEYIWKIMEYVLGIESRWWEKYIKNTDLRWWEEWSTAKWPYQIIDWYKLGVLNSYYELTEEEKRTEKRTGKKIIKYTNFQTSLRYVKKFYNKQDKPVPEYVNIALNNPGVISPLDLTFEQSTELFLAYLFGKSEAKGINRHLIAAIATWNLYAIKKLYSEIHHTSVNEQTENVMDKQLLALNRR